MKIGIYLEAGYKKEGEELFCEDIYTVLFNALLQETDCTYSFLGRQVESKSGNMYRIERYDRFFELTPYRDLAALCMQWSAFKKKNEATLESFVQRVDKLLVMSPMPICIELIKLGLKHNKSIVVLVRQDTRTMLPQRYSGVKRIAATILAHLFEHKVERLVQKNAISVLVLGNKIAQRFRRFTDRVYCMASSRYHLTDVLSPNELPPIDWQGTVRLLFIGRVEVNKGLRELLTCLSGDVPFEWTLTLVGDGAFMPEVKRLLSRHNIKDKVNLEGYVPFGKELMQIYRSHDILLLPSYSEGLPQVILEAMANGCAIMASRVGGIPDVVIHKQTGLLFSPKSVDELKQTLIYAQAHQAAMEQMRVEALQVARDYAFDNQVEVLKGQLED